MKKIFVAGHNGMVGRAICRKLKSNKNIFICTKSRSQLDLCNQNDVRIFMRNELPDEVIIAAAKVGGIYANDNYPAEFIYQNLQIQNNVINSAHEVGVQKLLFLGSSCIYPKLAEQPMKEDVLLSGFLESTNEPYAISKIAGIKMCESYNRQYGRDYRSVMPTNLYGPGDNYHSKNSHVVPALIRRFYEAKENNLNEVLVWGSGKAMREFLYVDDMADACIFVHELEKSIYKNSTTSSISHINIGTGQDVSIYELANIVKKVVGYDGKIHFDDKKSDGAPRKLLNINKLKELGWSSKIPLEDGIKKSYEDFINNYSNLRK
jgi:GDP-L-fucose synthase